MKPEIKAKWLEALRGGEYRQAKGALRKANRFCCLGVLCNLHALAHPKIAARECSPTQYMGETGFLPTAVQKWADIGHRGFLPDGLSLTTLNDNGETFKEIADVIEKQL